MTSATRPRRRRPRATAARQALGLCEATLAQDTGCIHSGQQHVSPATARAALRAVGVPPLIAAALRRRLRLIPEVEADQ